MDELRKKYFNTLGFTPSEASAISKREKALNRAYQLRSFEIEHYWKRANYFWAFQVAIFAAFGLLWRDSSLPTNCVTNLDSTKWGPVTVALSGLGVLTAVANYLSADGSKFWQENWEKQIEMLEDEIEGRLYKTVWLSEKKISYSVSSVNKFLSAYFIVFWAIVAFYVAWKFVGPPFLSWADISTWNYLLTGTLLASTLIGIVCLLCQTSSLRATLPQPNGVHGYELISRCPPWCKRICKAESRDFIRRCAPDEEPSPNPPSNPLHANRFLTWGEDHFDKTSKPCSRKILVGAWHIK
jgi:hypothetical protein